MNMGTVFEELVAAQHQDMFDNLKAYEQRLCQMTAVGDVGLDPAITEFGVRVKITDHSWVVLKRELYNWRICELTLDPVQKVPTAMTGVRRAWCYGGPNSFVYSLLSAVSWSGQEDTEPSGWIKSVFDERRNGEPIDGITQE